MATTTTNYGFDIPQSTDLVKDGATAIATLGQDIDTAMNTALGTKKAGMVLLNTTSFSGVGSIALPLDTFSATYKNYRLLFQITNSTNSTITLRGRAAGVDKTTAAYNSAGYFAGVTSAVTRLNTTGATAITLVTTTTTTVVGNMDLFDPNSAVVSGRGLFNYFNTAAGDAYNGHFTFAGTVLDSLNFIASTGTISGRLQAFGYNE